MHAPFTHSDMMNFDGPATLREVKAEETDWGVTWYESQGAGRRVTHFIMPNAMQSRRVPMGKSRGGNTEVLSWMMPLDDKHHQRFEVYFSKASEEEARRYMERFQNLERVPELGNHVLSGSLRLDEIDDRSRSRVQIEDYLVLVGQGTIPDRGREHLGRSDALVLLRRKIWERELRALAAGRPLKNWQKPERLETSFNRL
jgi:hypothetical protein